MKSQFDANVIEYCNQNLPNTIDMLARKVFDEYSKYDFDFEQPIELKLNTEIIALIVHSCHREFPKLHIDTVFESVYKTVGMRVDTLILNLINK